jgi:hypothetical protein
MSARIWLWGLLILACLGLLGITAQHRQLAGLKDQKGQILAQLSQPLDAQSASTASGEEPGKSAAGDSGPAAASSELLQLRNQLGQLTERKRELMGVRDQNGRLRAQFASRPGGEKLLPPDYIRKSSAQWVGLSTPENTLQSFLWTLQNRDLTNLFQVLTPEGAQRLSQMLTNEPNNFFAQSAAIPGMRIVEKNALADGSFELKVETVPGTPLPGPIRVRLVGNDWKLDFP